MDHLHSSGSRSAEKVTPASENAALAEVAREYAKLQRKDANGLGEMLRAWAFPGKGYGCYSNFDYRPEFVAQKVTPREFGLLWGRGFDPNDTDPSSWGYCDAEAMKEIRWFKHPNGIEMGWHWDGDGCLAFVIPGIGAIYNSDCKKDYEWEWTRETSAVIDDRSAANATEVAR
jgi:hypothetical protein